MWCGTARLICLDSRHGNSNGTAPAVRTRERRVSGALSRNHSASPLANAPAVGRNMDEPAHSISRDWLTSGPPAPCHVIRRPATWAHRSVMPARWCNTVPCNALLYLGRARPRRERQTNCRLSALSGAKPTRDTTFFVSPCTNCSGPFPVRAPPEVQAGPMLV